MAIDREQVIKIAKLARLSFSDAEIDELTGQLGNMLALVEQLGGVDTEGVEPMVHAVELVNATAADVLSPSLPREQALQNAPQTDGETFLVPAVL